MKCLHCKYTLVSIDGVLIHWLGSQLACPDGSGRSAK